MENPCLPGFFLSKKSNSFSSSRTYQLPISPHLVIRYFADYLLYGRICSSLSLYRYCAYCHSLWEFMCAINLLYHEKQCFLVEILHLWCLQYDHHLLQGTLSLGRRIYDTDLPEYSVISYSFSFDQLWVSV